MNNRRSFIISSTTALAASSVLAGGKVPKLPNIVLVMADDLGWKELGCYGQKKIRTPHIDQMAAEGMRFTQIYTGAPVCAPPSPDYLPCCWRTGEIMRERCGDLPEQEWELHGGGIEA